MKKRFPGFDDAYSNVDDRALFLAWLLPSVIVGGLALALLARYLNIE